MQIMVSVSVRVRVSVRVSVPLVRTHLAQELRFSLVTEDMPILFGRAGAIARMPLADIVVW